MNIQERKTYSEQRLEEIIKKVGEIDMHGEDENLCIYTTGSYARLEACEHSDIDLFFISEKNVSFISKTLIDAELIKLNRKLGIQEFSGDGKYLEIHTIEEILKNLGGREDDYSNNFTARLLMLLESKSIYNNTLYESAINKIIESYYRDFHEHSADFRPVFLINDIIRYWKTITLNYEHKRNRETEGEKSKSRVKNLKLKFSRKLMCFSFIISLLDSDSFDQNDLIKIVAETPINRIRNLNTKSNNVDYVLELYNWFLEEANRSNEEMKAWLDNRTERSKAFEKSNKFGDFLFKLIVDIDKKKYLKYLVA